MADNYTENNIAGLNTWPLIYSKKLILLTIVIILCFYLLFFRKIMPITLLLNGFIILSGFFLLLYYYSKNWDTFSPAQFYKRLFIYSLLFRLLYVAYIYLLTYLFDPGSFPFEINATDSWTYHLTAIKIKDNLFTDKLVPMLNSSLRDRSDWGFTIYTAIIYNFFGSFPIIIRLMNCLIGSLTVVFLSKIALNILSFRHARLTGIMAMLMPPLLWFGGMSLKETLMIFMVVSVLHYGTDYVINKRINIPGILILIIFTFSLLYFRTVLSILLFISLGTYFFINTTKKKTFKVYLLLSTFILATWFLIQTFGFAGSIEGTYGQSGNYFSSKMASKTKMVGNINYNLSAVTPLIFASSIVTPFPSFLYLEKRQLPIVVRFQNELIRNFLYYFAFLGLLYLFKSDFRKNSLIIMFTVGYIFVMAYSGYSFEDRFQLISLPPLLICISAGLIDSKPVWFRRWNLYLIAIVIVIFAWNFFKISIRGIQ